MNRYFTKDKVYVKVSDILFKEGKVIGYITHKGKTTYRVLMDETEIIDAEEDDILSEMEILKYKKEAKSA